MPSSLLYGASNEGRVYTLSTNSGGWREFPYSGLEFKKISAISNYLWAIGGDRQVYVHVHGLDVPIRVREDSYENERWLPIEGFSKMLLPTDRPRYSSADGSEERCIDKIRLPSMAWQWDGDWHLNLDLDGQTLGEDGWMYALDFQTNFAAKKSWNSYVRRRHWIRYRRYGALNSWCAVAPLHKDPTQEPFVDVAIGGTNIPNAPAGTLAVWAVTAHGRAMFRTGVSTIAPEGLRWTAIPTPAGSELIQLSVGPTGLVWAVLYNGRVIARSGVTRDRLSGEAWLSVKPPISSSSDSDGQNGLKVVQVSVGTNAVWCVTDDNSVWFRRGIAGELAGISEDAAIGNGWVEMIGNISMVSVAENDQVFAIGSADRALYYRFGVSDDDLTGKKWRRINLPMQISRTSSSMSIVSRKSGNSSTHGSKHSVQFSSLYSKTKEKGQVETCAPIENMLFDVNNGTLSSNGSYCAPPTHMKSELWKHGSNSPPNIGSLNLAERYKNRTAVLRETTSHASSAPATETTTEVAGKQYETQLKNPRAWSPVHSVGSVVGTEAHPEIDSSIFDADVTHHGSDAFLGDNDDHTGSQFWTPCDLTWSCVAAGAVTVNPNSLPNWFNEHSSLDNRIDVNANWRQDILSKLRKRQTALNHLPDSAKYVKAVELSSWIKSAEVRYQRLDNQEYEDCRIELEWVTGSSASTPTEQIPNTKLNNNNSNNSNSSYNEKRHDSGTFTVLHPDGVTTKIQFSLAAITCIQCCSEPASPRLAIHAPSCLPANCSPVHIQFSSDAEMEDWLSHLTSVCCRINDLMDKPGVCAVWATTDLGDVFVFDPANMKAEQWNDKLQCYQQHTEVNATETPYYNTLYNGMPPGAELELDGCVYDDADQIRFDLQCHAKLRLHVKLEKYRRIAMHLNPRFNEKSIVLNSMNDSQWLEETSNNNMVFAPGSTFTLKIRAMETYYQIFVNEKHFIDYKYFVDPSSVNCLYVSGRLKLFSIIYRCPMAIINMRDMFWRQIGGHIKRVYSCSAGVTWGISCDNTAWVYNGGWGGNFLKGTEGSIGKINNMVDTHTYYIYENQRWNPISGYTTKSLPTDRHMWSDATGRQKRSKEHTKLLSSHYEWISDWMIDFNINGGTDKDGWQYAIDFPAAYHAQKRITDCVRRRRWLRKCRLLTSGPWQELSHSKILDASLQVLENSNEYTDGMVGTVYIMAWAIASNGDVLLRQGVTSANPKGDIWEHIPSEQPLISISLTPNGQVWVVGRNGTIFHRIGITKSNPLGDNWQAIDAPTGVRFRAVSAGLAGIWALDNTNRLAVRKDISNVTPQGTHWQFLVNVANIAPHTDTHIGFKAISVSTEVWAIAMNGVICRRCGITKDNPAGSGWNISIPGQWQHLNITAYN